MGMAAMKIIMSVINSDPPSLSGSHFSKEFKDFVSLCLQKEPSKRPTAETLLKHKFLQKREDSNYLIDEFLADIDSLEVRIGDKLRYQGEGIH
jgi:serine/threonine protein kinase